MRHRAAFSMIAERATVAVVTNGEDIWQGVASTIPIPNQTTGDLMTIVSTSASDGVGGTGVRAVMVHYLDVNWAEATTTVTMNGTTPVNIPAIYIMHVQDIHGTVVGSNGSAVGTIRIYRTGDATRVYDLIVPGVNMSTTGRLMVPAGHEMNISNGTVSTSKDKPSIIRLLISSHHGTPYSGDNPIFQIADTIGLSSAPFGRSWDLEERAVVPAKAFVKMSIWASQAGGDATATLSGEFISLT